MNRGLYPVLAGAITHERNLELLAHNLGNIQTAGYKRDEPLFGTIFGQASGPRVPGIDLFPQIADVRPDITQGTLRHTGHDLDVALEGEGFFVVSTPFGLRYSRGGTLRVDGDRHLVTHSGDPLLGKNGPIKVPPGRMTIDEGGAVRVNNRVVGSLRIEQMPNAVIPIKVGDMYWLASDQAEEATGVMVRQAALEQANVNASLDMVEMIKVTRGYEQMQKAIQAMDDLTTQMIQSSRVQR